MLIKGSKSIYRIPNLGEIWGNHKTLPQVQDIEEERFEDTFGMLLLTQEEETAIRVDWI